MEQVSTEKLVDDLRTVVHDAEELLKATAGEAGDKIAAVRTRAEASLRNAKDRLKTMQNGMLGQARRAAAQTDAYVHENPWKSIGLGAAIGLLIGFLANRR